MKMNLPSLAAIVALTLGGALNANAGFVDVNLAGWQALGAFDASDDTENTRLVINLGTGLDGHGVRLYEFELHDQWR
jgi:hypothetical protein